MKRYLKTPEEVVKALKEGKTVKTDRDYAYALKDGFIIQSFLGEVRSINTTIFLDDKYYIECPKLLKLEVGKFYKTRNGKKVFVYSKINEDYPYPFFVAKVGVAVTYSVNADGRKTDEENPSDLVAPWEE